MIHDSYIFTNAHSSFVFSHLNIIIKSFALALFENRLHYLILKFFQFLFHRSTFHLALLPFKVNRLIISIH